MIEVKQIKVKFVNQRCLGRRTQFSWNRKTMCVTNVAYLCNIEAGQLHALANTRYSIATYVRASIRRGDVRIPDVIA